jgi:hypothetical protein
MQAFRTTAITAAAVVYALGVAMPAHAADAKLSRYIFTSFALPSPVTTTVPVAINAHGDVTGYANYPWTYFVWSHGTFSLLPGPTKGFEPTLTGIDADGNVVANYDTVFDSYPALWLRHALTPRVQVYLAPGGLNNTLDAINDSGVVGGTLLVASDTNAHGYTMTPSRVVTEFDPPGSVVTSVEAIADDGTVAGHFYTDPDGPGTGFIRNTDGSFVTFTPPGSVDMEIKVIGADGTIGGIAFVGNGKGGIATEAFTYLNGAFTTYLVPGSSYMGVAGIIPGGIVGTWQDSQGNAHAFTNINGSYEEVRPFGYGGASISAMSVNGTITGA